VLRVRNRKPQTPLESVARRRFLLTGWPWRSLGYLLTTPPLALAAAVPLAALGLPWVLVLLSLTTRNPQRHLGALVLPVVLGAIVIPAFGPMVAMPLAVLERWRLRIVDARPVVSGHGRPPTVGAWAWLRTRYSEAATWRELGYACLLVTVAPLAYAAVLTMLLLIAGLVASPFVVGRGDPVSLGFGEVTTAGQALPYALVGLALLPTIPYVLAVLAGAHGAVARALLQGDSGEQLRAELVDVSRSRARLVDAFETERLRIERDLHDGAQQRLVSLTLQLGLARLDVPPDSPAAATVATAHEQAKQLMVELRELIHGIRPQVLTDRGLPAALRELADQSPIPVTVDSELPARLPSGVEGTAYFVVAEALTNVAKHSRATGAGVTVRQRTGVLTVEIRDDGHGGADPHRGTGLTGLADRLAVIDGRMSLSSPAGGPTLLRVELPCSQNQPPSG
jgi:signal transduction histidine kinase